MICAQCGEEKPHYARGLCSACYHREYRARRKQEKRSAEEDLAFLRALFEQGKVKVYADRLSAEELARLEAI